MPITIHQPTVQGAAYATSQSGQAIPSNQLLHSSVPVMQTSTISNAYCKTTDARPFNSLYTVTNSNQTVGNSCSSVMQNGNIAGVTSESANVPGQVVTMQQGNNQIANLVQQPCMTVHPGNNSQSVPLSGSANGNCVQLQHVHAGQSVAVNPIKHGGQVSVPHIQHNTM